MIKHIRKSLIILIVLVIGLYFLMPYLIVFFTSPSFYLLQLGNFSAGLTDGDLQVAMLCILSCVSLTLFGYIIYLLLSSSTRASLISEYKTKELSSASDQLKELYENAPVPYLTINKDGEIRGGNKSALRFFGVLPQEIVSKNFFSFTAEEDKELGDKFLNFYKSDAPINREEMRMITKENGIKWVSLSVFLTKDSLTGEKNGLVTVFDITEQKQLSQAKTEFVSLASHQLRTPLATMKWFTEMIKSKDLGALNEKQLDYLNRIYSVNGEMIDLVETLLNVSRIEIGTLSITKQEVNVQEVVDSILVELSSQINGKKIVIEKLYNNALTNVNSDSKLLRIAIQNIITNAIKYNKDGGSVKIELKDDLGQNSIIVSDTGLGIPKEDQERIFTKLFRAGNVQNVSNSQSTGLGLYLTKSVIEALGGHISFKSEENVGTAFTLTL